MVGCVDCNLNHGSGTRSGLQRREDVKSPRGYAARRRCPLRETRRGSDVLSTQRSAVKGEDKKKVEGRPECFKCSLARGSVTGGMPAGGIPDLANREAWGFQSAWPMAGV